MTATVERVSLPTGGSGWRLALVERGGLFVHVRLPGKKNRKKFLNSTVKSQPVDAEDAKRFLEAMGWKS